MTIGQELETSQAAICGNVLILFADRLAETFDFNLAGLLGQPLRMNDVLPMGMQGLEQAPS